MATGWEAGQSDLPLPPHNGQVVSPYLPGVLDLRWDDPNLLAGNSIFTVVGVNVYRSDASDRGPYRRINEFPLGGSFYRDRTDNVLVAKETVRWGSDWISRGNAPNDRRWVLKTKHPIVKKNDSAAYQTPSAANAPKDVTLYIDGVAVPVHGVFGPSGEVTLINVGTVDLATEKAIAATLPTAESTVEISYYRNKNHVQSGLEQHVWYRLTTVALDPTTASGYKESPIGYCPPLSVIQTETLDYIWREGVRRNHWILQQGGERVKLFIRRTAGVPCNCQMDARTREYSKQPSNRCMACYGTGYLGGYDGPYDILVAPDDGADRRISQTSFGRRKEHTYEVWMGPSPLVTQRDFLVKQTNERFSCGAVRRPTNRGNVLQQHFTIAYFDQGDTRYRVPIDGTTELTWGQSRDAQVPMPLRPVDGALDGPEPWPVGPNNTHPMTTEHAGIPDERQVRGRSRVWENQNY